MIEYLCPPARLHRPAADRGLVEGQIMIAEADLQEYLDEIRQEVCSRCVERPEGGPPCTPLGKVCGVELYLPQLVEAVHRARSGEMSPYIASTRSEVCAKCAFLHHDCCPCPMESLELLIVQAVEAVDERRSKRVRQVIPNAVPVRVPSSERLS